ncbi:hypothetical protein BN341_11830 [Helicobacter heilmannii ASB1.4]|nr:hypothetical protein BN341_11830 [Helicobacter heilmannii ASB1.4]
MISTDKAMEMVSKKSSKKGGKGTMMIAKIAITKTTTVKSLDWVSCLKKGNVRFKMLFCLLRATNCLELNYIKIPAFYNLSCKI